MGKMIKRPGLTSRSTSTDQGEGKILNIKSEEIAAH